MDIIHALILSVVEGITEFLPISSTGHLILASQLLKIEQTESIKNVLLGNSLVTVAALFWGGILIIIVELFFKEKDHHVNDIGKISLKSALVIGLFQSISVVPGVSRAAATIIGARLMGVKRKTAAEFSFILALPTMLAATGLDLLKSDFSFGTSEVILLVVGFLGSFLVASLAIKFLLSYIQNHSFIAFGVYRIILAILFYLLILRNA